MQARGAPRYTGIHAYSSPPQPGVRTGWKSAIWCPDRAGLRPNHPTAPGTFPNRHQGLYAGAAGGRHRRAPPAAPEPGPQPRATPSERPLPRLRHAGTEAAQEKAPLAWARDIKPSPNPVPIRPDWGGRLCAALGSRHQRCSGPENPLDEREARSLSPASSHLGSAHM